MANGFEPKRLLLNGLTIPKSIEASLPAGVPSIVGVLASVANAMPDFPTPPMPAAAGAGPADFIKSVEASLPDLPGIPKLSAALGATSSRKEPGPTKAAAVKVMGGGYRSI